MAKVDADRNLLVGILALQMDLIGREALISAVGAWVADKGQPLDQILRKQRAIDAEAQGILAKMARKRSEERDSEPGRGAFASAVIDLVRADLAKFGDPDLDAGLARLRDPDRTETDPYATRPQSPGVDTLPTAGPTASGPDPAGFRLIRLHAKGGLGEVYLARDEQVRRDVAVKQLQERHADRPESRLRFVLEAEVTGSLEHPGVVPIYAVGRHVDGRPYYAMRFVDGTSLKEAIEAFHRADSPARRDPGARSIALRKLLRRFLDVCDTIDFAHGRGILHRDLKPANVMLGNFGETLVVDWGLAKRFDPAGATPGTAASESGLETMVGAPLGTPAYMSPEQAAGQVDRLGPASDVYSLGATLYHLLAGRPPFEGDDVGRILQRVARGQFPAPHRAGRGVPAPLAMICLKAMALDPAHRYPTPEALSDDVEHWLAGEPVSVYRDWIPRRVWRWGRGHRYVVYCVGAMTFVVIVVFLLTSLMLVIPGLVLAALGGVIGSLAGAARGQFSRGARQGSAVAFRLGIAVGAVLFVAGIAYEAFALARQGGPAHMVMSPGLDQLDGYRLAASRARAGDLRAARSWLDWADRWARPAPEAPGTAAEVRRARAEAVAGLEVGKPAAPVTPGRPGASPG